MRIFLEGEIIITKRPEDRSTIESIDNRDPTFEMHEKA